jgi:gamma-F420-2:alpha-L-glutamate ligase
MRGFLLYNGPKDNIEINLLLQEAKRESIELSIVNPREISIISSNHEKNLLINGEKNPLPDFVFSAFANDFIYQNQALVKQLETMGVLCVNTIGAMLTSQDKLLTNQLLAETGIPVPKTMLLSSMTTVEIVESQFTYPVVLKALKGQKGSGVLLLHNRNELKNILQLHKIDTLNDEFILQEMIETSKGRDIRVMTFNYKAKCCVIRQAKSKEEFKSNFSLGGTTTPVELTPQIIEIAEKSAKKLGIFLAGIDLLFTDDGFMVCEANSMPGFRPSKGEIDWKVDVPATIFKSIKDALRSKK